MKTGFVVVAALALTFPALAQWSKVPNRALSRSRTGEVNMTAPAPKRAGKPDLSGTWLADAKPLPQGILAVEGEVEFLSPHLINVAADLPPEQVAIQPWANELFQQRLASEGKLDPAGHCKPAGLPIQNATPLPFKIVQTADLVLVLYETDTVFRQIFLDGRKPVADAEPRYLGYSTGRWEGDALVIETTGFNDHRWLDALGHPTTAKLHLTERFRRTDTGHLTIETTIDDPGAYTKPFTYTLRTTLIPDEDLLEAFCSDNEKDAQHYQ